MICPPCATAADLEADVARTVGTTHGHAPEICRDHGLTPSGCGCQHRPAGAATDRPDAKETDRA